MKRLEKINEINLQPGDKVLLEADSVFTNDYLHIKGSGSEEAPIVIDRYGEGADPRIDTNGQGVWYQDYGTALDMTDKIMQVMTIVGTVIAIAGIMVLGIKYMVGSVEQKAEYKKTMLPYFIGCFFIFAVPTIVSVIYSIVSKI